MTRKCHNDEIMAKVGMKCYKYGLLIHDKTTWNPHFNAHNLHILYATRFYFCFETPESHLELHKPGKDFPCPYCKKVFMNRTKLKFHSRVHKSASGTLRCDHCDKVFQFQNSLTYHLRVCSWNSVE